MKKRIIFCLILSLFLLKMDVYAFDKRQLYNYEVTSLVRDDNGNVTVSGWAIPNAGVDDDSNGFSPSMDDNLGSGSTGSCYGAAWSFYEYTLYVVGIDNNGNLITDEGKRVKIDTKRGSGISLTEALCYRSNANSNCVWNRSSCYENVGWTFSYNENELVAKISEKNLSDFFKNGYALYMRLNPTPPFFETKIREFALAAHAGVIKGFGNDYTYTNNGDNLTVKVIAYHGRYQSCNGNTCQTMNDNKFIEGGQYSVVGYTKDLVNSRLGFYGVTYYQIKIGDTYPYIPVSWVAPLNVTILPSPSKVRDVSGCDDDNKSQVPKTIDSATCGNEATFSGDNYSTCSVNKYSYYTKKCSESDFKASFKINNLVNETRFYLRNGGGFEVNGTVSTKLECEYTFDIEHFKKDYNDVVYNLNVLDNGSREWYSNNLIKEKLENIFINYSNQTSDITSWNSEYDFTKINATVKVDGNEVSKLTVETNDIVNEKIDLNGDMVNEENFCITGNDNKIEKLSINSREYVINTNVKCGENWNVVLSLPEMCLNMANGEMTSCTASNVLVGGKKYYVPRNKTSGNITLEVSNLGYDGNFKMNLTKCAYSSGTERKVIFRQIDITDPFLSEYSNNRRVIGRNYYNNKYNFVNIIKSDIWQELYQFKYSLSKVNIENIKKNTLSDSERVSSYLGSRCYFNSVNKWVCEFTRNNSTESSGNSNFFTKVDIHE